MKKIFNNNYSTWKGVIHIQPFITLFFMIACCSISGYAQSYNPVEINGKWGFIDENSDLVIDTAFVFALPFNAHGLAPVVDDSGWVYIDACGNKMFRPFIYDNGPDYFVEGLARFQKSNKIGFVSTDGEVIIEARFDFVRPFSEGMAAFCTACKVMNLGEHQRYVGGKWGFINKKGAIVITARFDEVHDFINKRAQVVIDGKEFSIDKKGMIIK
jgi:hypothetical protein